jgi:Family of unknown function (DUF5309)
MAIITGTALTFSGSPGLQGLREDLSDFIYMVSPTDTPFMSNVGRGTADAVLHEWQTDALAAANVNNAQFQGDDIATFSAASVTTRLGNRTQISRKEVIISGTVDAVNKAGRKTELAYQLMKRSKELKNDIESICLSNQAKVVGAAATAPKLASVLSWIKTNVDHVGTNPTGDGTDARVDGTQRAFTETLLKNVLKLIYTNSSENLDVLMVGPSNKQVASTFTGNATKQVEVSTKKIIATVDIYVGDFHTINIIPNRFMRTRDALLLNWEYWSIDWLRPIKQVELATTGDAQKRMLLGEYTLVAKNEMANGAIYDLTVP